MSILGLSIFVFLRGTGTILSTGRGLFEAVAVVSCSLGSISVKLVSRCLGTHPFIPVYKV